MGHSANDILEYEREQDRINQLYNGHSEYYQDCDSLLWWDKFNTNICTEKDIPEEFYDILKVMNLGAEKYGKESYLKEDNKSLQHKANCASMHRHLAAVTMDDEAIDLESEASHYLHLATRALMRYTRLKRGVIDNG